ncbi:unnamed protein product [Paramecium octaurelia]|uniref:Uncharacterized protein n=1 Tax=Paramecium octaurelia TaxID=43137 RepID=A0A8S1YK34_PAROT|nr:unnamed protein product [Paramecium octaurelia]CAD8213783.1 unnamed protein product [Paramecium octaurelia]
MSKLLEFKISNVVNLKLWPNPRTTIIANIYFFGYCEIELHIQGIKEVSAIYCRCSWRLFVTKLIVDGVVKSFIFGENRRTCDLIIGQWRKIVRDEDIQQQFLEMRYLIELPAGDDPLVKTSDYLQHDLGFTTFQDELQHNVIKRVPHDKYML